MNHQKPWTNEEDLFLVNNYETMSNEELSEKLGRTKGAILKRANLLVLNREYVYACYEGDDIVFTGRKQECADYWNVKKSTIDYYISDAYKKRIEGKNNRRVVERI